MAAYIPQDDLHKGGFALQEVHLYLWHPTSDEQLRTVGYSTYKLLEENPEFKGNLNGFNPT